MDGAQAAEQVKMIAKEIPGYEYGSHEAARSPISMAEFDALKQSAGFTPDDEQWLRQGGEVLRDQAKELVGRWREVIAKLPHLATYSQSPEGKKDPRYSQRSGLRFEQWVLDTCLRPYDQDWLNYQQEIALRHTSLKKNMTDDVQSAPTIHLRHIIAFGAVVTDPEILKSFFAKKGHGAAEVEKMYRAWSKSIWLQIALWTEPYTNSRLAPNEW